MLFVLNIKFLGKTKVDNLVLALMFHNVIGLQITMNDVVIVQFLSKEEKYSDSIDNLSKDLDSIFLLDLSLSIDI